MPNPMTKATALRMAGAMGLDGTAGASFPAPANAGTGARVTTTPSWPRYAGTTGRTHGDRNEMSPANRAAPSVRSTRALGRPGHGHAQERAQLATRRDQRQLRLAHGHDGHEGAIALAELGIGVDIHLAHDGHDL